MNQIKSHRKKCWMGRKNSVWDPFSTQASILLFVKNGVFWGRMLEKKVSDDGKVLIKTSEKYQ